MRKIIVICGSFREFTELMRFKYKDEERSFDVPSLFCDIKKTRFMYASYPRHLYGVEIGIEYFLYGDFKFNACYGDEVLLRFKKIELKDIVV